jgi:hypothetical protein
MKRSDFLKSGLGASLGALALHNPAIDRQIPKRENLISSISRVNDQRVQELSNNINQLLARNHNRSFSGFILTLSAAHCAEESDYFRNENLIEPMAEIVRVLLRNQYPNGTFDSGNLQSPPDSAFMIEQLWRAQALLINDNTEHTMDLRENLQTIILNTAEALVTGGVHTPNHRWAICAALAGVHTLYPDPIYSERIDDWLGEGIGQDADGQHPERSPNYDAAVNNQGLLDVAVLMNREELFQYIRKNLKMTLYLTELNGEVETVASRRQDQDPGRKVMIHRYYIPYRFMALKDKNPHFAEVAKLIETKFTSHLSDVLPDLLLHEELNHPLPQSTTLPDRYTKYLPGSGLVRIRRKETTASVFGGTDWHLGHGAWSGLSTNPTFFKLRKGEAILESVRMSPAFFSTGYFRSESLDIVDNAFHLKQERRVPYHQPLPARHRKGDGIYTLSPDGRFFSKMDFKNRPKDFMTLQMRVVVKEVDDSGAFELDFLVDQTENVPVTVELCFRKGGELSGVIPMENDSDSYFLKDGYGSYNIGGNSIKFGPGMKEHARPPQPNEQYTVHNGGIHPEGYRVYLTGFTPFRHQLKIV